MFVDSNLFQKARLMINLHRRCTVFEGCRTLKRQAHIKQGGTVWGGSGWPGGAGYSK